MGENQENNNSIIDSYDGDPDEQIFFQPPQTEKEAEESEYGEEQENRDIYDEQGSLRAQETADRRDSSAEPSSDSVREQMKASVPVAAPGVIDPNDPHYVNYKPDLYYEYGQGPEPKGKNMEEGKDKQDGTTLAIISLSTGIASLLMSCCGSYYLFSAAALTTGIWCLCLKNKSKTNKILSITGIVLALLPTVLVIMLTLYSEIMSFIVELISP